MMSNGTKVVGLVWCSAWAAQWHAMRSLRRVMGAAPKLVAMREQEIVHLFAQFGRPLDRPDVAAAMRASHA